MIRKILITGTLGLSLLFADAVTDAAKKKIDAGKYDEAIADLDAAYQKNPKSAEYKKALANAHFANGNFMMNNANMPPMRKYPGALRAFRKTVELDPTNTQAKTHIKTIEDIYKSMGRPVPQ
jgi:tetratricopeptide (TPR) repeat protein